MDNLQKATQMARINLMKEIIAKRTNQSQSLEQMALELMAAGSDKTQIAQILSVREKLSPSQQRALETILETMV